MSFGLTNASTSFMDLMNQVFKEYLHRFFIVFIDDILVYYKTKEEHEEHLRLTLQQLREHQMEDPDKVDAVKECPRPKNASKVRSFMGLADYYMRFVERINEGQTADKRLSEQKQEIQNGNAIDHTVLDTGLIKYKGRIFVSDNEELKKENLVEAHTTPYSIHPMTTKMYHDLKALYWWSEMKKDVVDYVTKCLTC
ncbi:uncharacterized protein LOC133825665 [Humulus lupulus]|uniref:uncharacterized protein LOC133825665 n=1 Tax=Humulus lupulus TaxID=3486 RepID=UPI002B41558B|nr:uncharacterized protein LOC133825665 [Humulus lupulus]